MSRVRECRSSFMKYCRLASHSLPMAALKARQKPLSHVADGIWPPSSISKLLATLEIESCGIQALQPMITRLVFANAHHLESLHQGLWLLSITPCHSLGAICLNQHSVLSRLNLKSFLQKEISTQVQVQVQVQAKMAISTSKGNVLDLHRCLLSMRSLSRQHQTL